MTIWYIYGLIDPRDMRVFYVGMTVNMRGRKLGHKSDPASSAYHRCRDIFEAGLEIGMCILGQSHSKQEAKILEGRLVLILPDLVNRKSYHALPSDFLTPGWRELPPVLKRSRTKNPTCVKYMKSYRAERRKAAG